MARAELDVGRLVQRHIESTIAKRRPDLAVLGEVVAERTRQDEKWGQQDHPDLSPSVDGMTPTSVAAFYGLPTPARAKALVDTAAELGLSSWLGIAAEELVEALEAAALGDEAAVRAEVVQLAAVCVQWVQAIDRRQDGACSCGYPGLTYDGPHEDCPTHGRYLVVTPRESEHHPHEDVQRARDLLDGESGEGGS